MTEQDPSQPAPDTLYLSGKPHFNAAISALAMSGFNPEAEAMLRTIRGVKDPTAAPEVADIMTICLYGEPARQAKADIVASATLVEGHKGLSPQARAAARSLLDSLMSRQ